jgi:hypothetical protein
MEQRFVQECQQPVVVFNFGQTGAGPVSHLLTLKRLQAEDVRPDLLLIEVLPVAMASNFPGGEQHRLTANMLSLNEVRLLTHYGARSRPLFAQWIGGMAVPWYSQRFNLLGLIAPDLRNNVKPIPWEWTFDDSGWFEPPFGEVTEEKRRQATERAYAESAHFLSNPEIGGTGCNALKDLLQLCRKDGIKTALVWTPEGPLFQSWYAESTRTQLEALVGKLSREYRAPLIDGRSWVEEKDFIDSHHLLPSGAHVFTARLGEEVLPLLEPRLEERASLTLWKEGH